MCQIYHLVISVAIEIAIITGSAIHDEPKCNFRSWYLKMNAKGLFDGELSEEQLEIQDAVSEMMMISKTDRSKNFIECSTLKVFEEILTKSEKENSQSIHPTEDRSLDMSSEKEEMETGRHTSVTKDLDKSKSEKSTTVRDSKSDIETAADSRHFDKRNTESITSNKDKNKEDSGHEDGEKEGTSSTSTGGAEIDESEIDETEFGEEEDYNEEKESDRATTEVIISDDSKDTKYKPNTSDDKDGDVSIVKTKAGDKETKDGDKEGKYGDKEGDNEKETKDSDKEKTKDNDKDAKDNVKEGTKEDGKEVTKDDNKEETKGDKEEIKYSNKVETKDGNEEKLIVDDKEETQDGVNEDTDYSDKDDIKYGDKEESKDDDKDEIKHDDKEETNEADQDHMEDSNKDETKDGDNEHTKDKEDAKDDDKEEAKDGDNEDTNDVDKEETEELNLKDEMSGDDEDTDSSRFHGKDEENTQYTKKKNEEDDESDNSIVQEGSKEDIDRTETEMQDDEEDSRKQRESEESTRALTEKQKAKVDGTSNINERSEDVENKHKTPASSKPTIKLEYGTCTSRYSHPLDVFSRHSNDGSDRYLNIDTRYFSQKSYCSKRHVVSPSNCLLKYTAGLNNPVQESKNGPDESTASPLKEPTSAADDKMAGIDTQDKPRSDLHNNKRVNSDIIHDGVTSDEQPLRDRPKHERLDLHELEEYIKSKTLEYTHKIQSLEITIARLENTLLLDKLNEQNHSGTISRLENHVLKLENELLKITKGYHEIKYQNEMLQKGQRKYLELGHTQNSYQKSYQGLSNNVTKHFEVISQHQAKISQMSKLLENQADVISEMKQHSDYMENQNRMLYQMIVNQTALMSQIMGRVQDLTEQNTEQKEETRKLRQDMEISVIEKKMEFLKKAQNPEEISNQILQKLADSVSNTLLSTPVLSDNLHLMKKSEADQMKTRPSISTKSNYLSEWCSEPVFCHKKFFLLSFCPPYSIFSWNPCESQMVEPQSTTDKHGPHMAVPSQNDHPVTSNEEKEKTQKDEEQGQSSSLPAPDDAVEAPKITSDKSKDPEQQEEYSKRQSDDAVNDNVDVKKEQSSEEKQKDPRDKEESSSEHIDSKENGDKEKTKDTNDKSKPKVISVDTSSDQAKKKADVKGPTEPKIKRGPLKYSNPSQTEPKDCYDLYKLGKNRNAVYKIKPHGQEDTFQVFCDMSNGGWTLFQKRSDGMTEFFRKWAEYKSGFGGVYGEHWLGNEYIHHITNQDHYVLRIELVDWDRVSKHAQYEYFMIDNEDEGYRLHIDGYSGDAGDGMKKHNGHKFSTKDVDNDKLVKEFGGSCANRFRGAWWFYKCYQSNLNGQFYRGGVITEKMYDGITWKPWKGPNYSMRQVIMKLLPHSANLEGS